MKKIIYSSPYVPAELIAACAFIPSRITPSAAESLNELGQEGVCSYIRAFAGAAIKQDNSACVVFTTVCDQARRTFDTIQNRIQMPAFLINVPATWQSESAQKLYRDELVRLGKFLAGLGGEELSEKSLSQKMYEYDTSRKSVLNLKDSFGCKRFSNAISRFNQYGQVAIDENQHTTSWFPDGIPVAMVGGPLLKEDFELFDKIREFGGVVVLDATETGERGLCRRFDEKRLFENPLAELVDAYFNINDISRRPNTRFYDWFGQKLNALGVKGIIFRRHLWCDIWHAELGRMKSWTEIPVLEIDSGSDGNTINGQTLQRLSAFMEMLQ